MKELRHIAICGNIGCGKTTLAGKLAKHYGWHATLESVEDNPYLRDFYGEMSRWAFHVQIYFLNSRFRQINEIRASKTVTVQDRTIYEDAHIFASNLYKTGHMNERDYRTYLDVFNSMISYVQPPDLLIYLRADIPKLVDQIQKRGRDYEASIRLDYLRNLNEHYNQWIRDYTLGKLLIIDVDQLDFVKNVSDFAFVVNKIDFEINNLFNQ
jgi:deoxyadenosine/deoxycytidine kinase